MKYSISDNIEALAFDLDGTLYDEYDFIKQAYYSVSEVIHSHTNIDQGIIYEYLCRLWLKYGSSYNTFQDAFNNFCHTDMDKELLKKCVNAYRNTEIELSLSKEVIELLDSLGKYPKVIITDGDSTLQRKKYKALGLDRWFSEDSVFVTGDYGKENYKPNPYVGELVKDKLHTNKILYFGDRDIDKQFAENVGFEFIKMNRR